MVCNLNVEDSLSGFKHHARLKVCKLRIKILLLLKYKFFFKKKIHTTKEAVVEILIIKRVKNVQVNCTTCF
jgi:hypothetical protein